MKYWKIWVRVPWLTYYLLAEEQNHEKIKIYKTLTKVRYAKKDHREKSTNSQFVKFNPREMLKKMYCENKTMRKFLSLMYLNGTYRFHF